MYKTGLECCSINGKIGADEVNISQNESYFLGDLGKISSF